MEQKKFSYSFNEEDYLGIYDTVEECLDEAKYSSDFEDIVGESEDENIIEVGVWVGEIKEPTFKVDAQNILEYIEEDFYEQCGEYADGWLTIIKQPDIDLLSSRLNVLIEAWMIETNNQPSFYTVENAKKHTIKA